MGGHSLNLGFNQTIPDPDILAILSPDGTVTQRIIRDASDRGNLKDVTQGRPTRSVILSQQNPSLYHNLLAYQPLHLLHPPQQATDPTEQVFLCAMQPETVAERCEQPFHSDVASILLPISMEIKLINIGFGNIVSANRVIAIVSPESAPIRRMINEARDRGQLVDATYGRRTRAVIVMDVGHVILSAIQPETVANRFMTSKDNNNPQKV